MILGGSIGASLYRISHVIPGLPNKEVLLPGFIRGPGGRVTGGAPPVPAQDWLGVTVGEHSASLEPPTLLNIIPKDVGVDGVPRKGLREPVNEPHQPPDSLCVPPRVGHDGNSRRR